MGTYLSRFLSYFKRKDPRTPVSGVWERVKNIFTVHFRGILGVLVPLALLSWQPEKGVHHITVKCVWFWMFWFFLLQPVNVPVVGFIPIFAFPMAGVMSTADVCRCYFNENLALFVLGGMLHLLLNSCGVDRRIILWFLCSGDSCQFSGKRIVLKASSAAFFLSMISNRLVVTSTIIQYLTPAYMSLQSATSRYRGTEPNYDIMRHIVINSVQTASSIGSITIIHASFVLMTMRAIWSTHPPKWEEFPDIFNYLQYTCFAFPVAFLMFILNFVYHMILINWIIVKPMSGNSMTQMRDTLLQHKKSIPATSSCYQKVCIFFYFLFLAVCFFRWSDWLNKGWSGFRKITPDVPLIKDATVAAIFVVMLHVLPRSFRFLKFITADTRTELGTLRPESAIMPWRYVDKNTNYGYIILIGGGIALNMAIRISQLDFRVRNELTSIISMKWAASVLVVCLVAIVLANVMTGVAACCVFLPVVLHMATPPDPPAPIALAEPVVTSWPKHVYLGALAVGIGTSLGFSAPFLYTPAYFCHYVGKVPKSSMIKYSLGSVIICLLILWLSICYWAPIIWDPKGYGITSYTLTASTEATTTAAAGAEAAPPPPAL